MPAMPASASVGTSGSAAIRFALETASAYVTVPLPTSDSGKM